VAVKLRFCHLHSASRLPPRSYLHGGAIPLPACPRSIRRHPLHNPPPARATARDRSTSLTFPAYLHPRAQSIPSSPSPNPAQSVAVPSGGAVPPLFPAREGVHLPSLPVPARAGIAVEPQPVPAQAPATVAGRLRMGGPPGRASAGPRPGDPPRRCPPGYSIPTAPPQSSLLKKMFSSRWMVVELTESSPIP